MSRKLSSYLLLLTLSLLASCSGDHDSTDDLEPRHEAVTLEFMRMVKEDPALKELVEKTLALGAAINPDKNYNPAQDLESLYSFLDWSTTCMPWECLGQNDYPTLYNRIDQSTGYFWFIFDQPLDELRDKGYYYPSLHYHEPIASWETSYSKTWGAFLDTPESWCNEYYQLALADDHFSLKDNLYESPSNWHSFNDFFSRRFLDIDHSRPLGTADVLSPADSWPQGFWPIDNESQLPRSIAVKSVGLTSIRQLIGEGSAYCDAFAGGTFTHNFLDIDCYHRFHAPVSGRIREIRHIPGANAGGGITTWDPENRRYVYDNETGFQMIETRACLIIETPEHGLVAMLPIGMSQICSVNINPDLHVGDWIERGDEVGYFAFGGSDICLIFQSGVEVSPLVLASPYGGYPFSEARSSLLRLTPRTNSNPQ